MVIANLISEHITFETRSLMSFKIVPQCLPFIRPNTSVQAFEVYVTVQLESDQLEDFKKANARSNDRNRSALDRSSETLKLEGFLIFPISG